MLRTLEEKIDPKHTAVIVVDVQNDFCHPDSPLAKDGRDLSAAQDMVPRLAGLIDDARATGVPVIFIQMVSTDATISEVAREQRLRTRPWADPDDYICKEGSWGAEFYVVGPQPGETVVKKHRYSAFIGTDLDLILRSMGVKTLIMTGVATNVCVESTARDGFMRDYYIVFAGDCSACYWPQRHDATLENMDATFGVVADASDISNVWSTIKQPVAV
jgi:ureidoacrylate peracid hydrolase